MINSDQEQQEGMLNNLIKISYLILLVSLIPILLAYFAYGSNSELIDMGITFTFCFGLGYLIFNSSIFISRIVFFIGFIVLIIEINDLKGLWFDNEGGDKNVVYSFTLQMLFTLFVLYLLLKQSLKKRVVN